MDKIYKVKKTESDNITESIWAETPYINVDVYPWENNGYKPVVEGRMRYTDSNLHIYFKAFEKEIKAVYRQLNDQVCEDSCVEFFFNPKPETDKRYLNFEMNPLGTLLLGIGEQRKNRILIEDVDLNIFQIQTSVDEKKLKNYSDDFWTVQYRVPFKFLEKYYGEIEVKSGMEMSANFYKCGDHTLYPHYACWNPIEAPEPDFHRPEFFGTIILD